MTIYNQLLLHRGLSSIPSPWIFSDYIEDEYYREFIGEGQLFFFYKRLAKSSIRSAIEPYDEISFNASDYVLPIPDAETQYN